MIALSQGAYVATVHEYAYVLYDCIAEVYNGTYGGNFKEYYYENDQK